MSIKYTVYLSGTFVFAAATDKLTLNDIESYWHQIINDDRIKCDFRLLFDVTHISTSEMNLEAFQKVRDLIRNSYQIKRTSQLAIVVGTQSSYDNARNYERLVEQEQEQVIVFNSLRTAMIWLGVDGISLE